MLSLPVLFFMMLFSQPDRCDLDRVSHAVAVQETGECKTGVGKYHNCHGLRANGHWLHFNSPQESHEYFKRLWMQRYSGGCPTILDAERYDGKDDAKHWLEKVNLTLYG